MFLKRVLQNVLIYLKYAIDFFNTHMFGKLRKNSICKTYLCLKFALTWKMHIINKKQISSISQSIDYLLSLYLSSKYFRNGVKNAFFNFKKESFLFY